MTSWFAQAELCKFLVQNSRTEELAVLSLTLRVVFNLFNVMKRHLKVQLEVFFTSVHLCISNSKSARAEHRELALESLLVCPDTHHYIPTTQLH